MLRAFLLLCSTMLLTGDGPGGPGDPPLPDPAKQPVTLTNEQLNNMIAAEKRKGASGAVTELLQALGFAKPDDLKAFVDTKKQADDAAMTELERREKAAADRDTAAAAREAQAAAREHTATVRAILAETGATGDNLADAEALVTRTLAVGADDAAIRAEVDKLKTRRSELFAAAPRRQTPPGSPGSPPPANPGGNSTRAGDKGLAEAKRRGFVRD